MKGKLKKNDSLIVFVVDHIKPRVVKIGYALRKKGFFVVLFIEKERKEELKKSQVQFFDRAYGFTNKNDLYNRCLGYKPLVYHVFTEAEVPEWAPFLIENKKKLGKIVYDQYDVYRGLSYSSIEGYIEREKYCMENADGLCCRHFETQYLKQKYNYHYKGKRILFFDYCWDVFENFQEEQKRNGLKFCYGGRMLSLKVGNEQARVEWEGINSIIDSVGAVGGTFIMIPNVKLDRQLYGNFFWLTRRKKNFVLKESMDIQSLIQYESTMDYGVDCLEIQEKIDIYNQKYFKNRDYWGKSKFYATNKYFDYLDAGIPVIYGRKGEMFGWYLHHYGCAIPCMIEELPQKLKDLEANREIYKENTKMARKALSIMNNINRLITFYQNI